MNNHKIINLVILGNFSYPDGMAGSKRVQHFIDYLMRWNISIKILLLRFGRKRIEKDQQNGYHKGIYYKIIGNSIIFSPIIIIHLIKYFISGVIILFKWHQRDKKNILYCYSVPGLENLFLLVLAKVFGYKIIFDVIEDFTLLNEKKDLLKKIRIVTLKIIQKNIYILSDGIVTISHHLYSSLKTGKKSNIPIELIPISAHIIKRNGKTKFNNPIKIVYSGSFADKDEVSGLIDAFCNVRKRNKNIELLLTGKGKIETIEALKKKIEGKKTINYYGYLADKEFYEMIKKADILCAIRKNTKFANAGFPFKLGEYLATGNPVIVTNTGDVEKYVENRKDVYLIQPEDKLALKKTLTEIIQNNMAAMKIGKAGQIACLKYFNPEENGKKLLNLMKKI